MLGPFPTFGGGGLPRDPRWMRDKGDRSRWRRLHDFSAVSPDKFGRPNIERKERSTSRKVGIESGEQDPVPVSTLERAEAVRLHTPASAAPLTSRRPWINVLLASLILAAGLPMGQVTNGYPEPQEEAGGRP